MWAKRRFLKLDLKKSECKYVFLYQSTIEKTEVFDWLINLQYFIDK